MGDMLIYFSWMLSVGLSCVTLAKGNTFNRKETTLRRFIASCLVVWVYLVISVLLMNFIDPRIFGDNWTRKVYDEGGAQLAFAIYFGWLYALLISSFSWVLIKIIILVSLCCKSWRAKIGRHK